TASPASGALTVDSVAVAVGDRILVKNETASHNGIYVVTTIGTGIIPWVLTRAIDSDDAVDFAGVIVLILVGTVNATTAWFCAAVTSIVVGTYPITFTQYQVGQGTSVGGDLTGTVGNAALVGIITAGGPVGDSTHVPQITYDAKGRLTAVSSVAISGAPPTGVATTVTVEPEASYKSFTITDANVSPTSHIIAQICNELDPVICDTHARAGSFDLMLYQTDPESNGFLKGIYNIQYLIAA